MDINKEAEDYAKKIWGVYFDDKHPDVAIEETQGEISIKDFIAGANSKSTQAKVIQEQIGLLSDMYKSYRNGEFFDTEELIQNFEKQLQQQLKELEDE